MKMFRYMNDIILNDYDQFLEQVNEKRNQMIAPDICQIKSFLGIFDLEKLEKVPNGRFDLCYKGMTFECFFHYKSTSRLYTFLNGALTEERPQFSRWSYHSFVDGCYLNIADPMYGLYDDLILGWYYGNDILNLRQLIAEVTEKIAEILKIQGKDIIFVGSSGGGAAVVECSSFINGSKSVAINPQVKLVDWFYSTEFSEITGIDLNIDKLGHRNNFIPLLKRNENNYHLIIVNVRSQVDMRQIQAISKELDIQLKYGINTFDNCCIWLYDADCQPYVSWHSTQEFYCIFFAIEFLLDNIENLESEKWDEFFRLMNEFWHYRWELEKYWRNKIPKLEMLIECRENRKSVAIWGTGNIAQKLEKELFEIRKNNLYNIRMVIDNDYKKRGKFLDTDISIIHPSEIIDWSELYIIITTENYYEEIMKQLEEEGLCYKKDFIYWKDLF